MQMVVEINKIYFVYKELFGICVFNINYIVYVDY